MTLDDDRGSSGGESGGYDSGGSDSGVSDSGESSGFSGAESGGNFDFSDTEIESDGEKFDFDESATDTVGDRFDVDSEDNLPDDFAGNGLAQSEKADFSKAESSETADVSSPVNLEMEYSSEAESPTKSNNSVEIKDEPVVNENLGTEETAEIHNEKLDINSQLSDLRGHPQEALAAIGKDNLVNRIEKDTSLDKDADMDSRFIDITRAKGFLQEEMIKSTLINDFEVSDHTVKSVHEDGSITYTDIEAVAKHDIELNGGVVISAGEKLAIESKAGNEKYIAAQIDHIDKQLQGMPEDAYHMLFVTADVNRLSEEDRARLDAVLQKNNAEINIMSYYAIDLTDTIMHMRIDNDVQLRSDEYEEIEEMNPSSLDAAETEEIADDGKENAEIISEKLSFGSVVEALFGSKSEKGDKASESANESVGELSEDSETTEQYNAESEALIAREQERLEADRETVNRFLEENKGLGELSEEERASVLNFAIVKAMEHDPSLTLDKAEDYRNKIQFVTLSEVAKDTGMDLNYARRIQGYYSPEGGMKINVNAYGFDTNEALVTIEHEAIHMLSQRYDNNDKAIPGFTGLKNNNLP